MESLGHCALNRERYRAGTSVDPDNSAAGSSTGAAIEHLIHMDMEVQNDQRIAENSNAREHHEHAEMVRYLLRALKTRLRFLIVPVPTVNLSPIVEISS